MIDRNWVSIRHINVYWYTSCQHSWSFWCVFQKQVTSKLIKRWVVYQLKSWKNMKYFALIDDRTWNWNHISLLLQQQWQRKCLQSIFFYCSCFQLHLPNDIFDWESFVCEWSYLFIISFFQFSFPEFVIYVCVLFWRNLKRKQ